MSAEANKEEDFSFQCQDEDGVQCASTCVSIQGCNACNCRLIEIDAGGPWGDFMDAFLCISPIIVLLYVTIKKDPFPTTRSLPLAAALMWLIRLMYLDSDPLLACASVIAGILEALTPLSIMAGAITLFETMEATYCLPYMMREMKALTNGHPIAELMLIYAFAQMVEGASGFGTPAALGAPMLVSNGT
jgi:lactate permease